MFRLVVKMLWRRRGRPRRSSWSYRRRLGENPYKLAPSLLEEDSTRRRSVVDVLARLFVGLVGTGLASRFLRVAVGGVVIVGLLASWLREGAPWLIEAWEGLVEVLGGR